MPADVARCTVCSSSFDLETLSVNPVRTQSSVTTEGSDALVPQQDKEPMWSRAVRTYITSLSWTRFGRGRLSPLSPHVCVCSRPLVDRTLPTSGSEQFVPGGV